MVGKPDRQLLDQRFAEPLGQLVGKPAAADQATAGQADVEKPRMPRLVIRALIQHGITPDIIVGTSIGAVVGGCQAAGRLDLIEDWARRLTRRGLLSYLDISLSGGGLIGGGKLAAQLDSTLSDIAIESLPMRFATITTEIGTGHEIWLTRGRLVDAIRASYALPGVFPPVSLDGRWLVDGALVNPVPVSAARVLGADW